MVKCVENNFPVKRQTIFLSDSYLSTHFEMFKQLIEYKRHNQKTMSLFFPPNSYVDKWT